MSDVILSNSEMCVCINVKPVASYRYTPQVLHVSSLEVSSALTVCQYLISDCKIST